MRTLPILLFLLTFGCQKPDQNLMDEDKMVECLIEFHLAEARMQGANLAMGKSQQYFLPKEKELLAKYNGDSLFLKSYQYYLLHPKELEAIYDRMIDSLSLREVRLKNPK